MTFQRNTTPYALLGGDILLTVQRATLPYRSSEKKNRRALLINLFWVHPRVLALENTTYLFCSLGDRAIPYEVAYPALPAV